MKVITYCKIDMSTMETIEEESFEYSGPVAMAGGSSTNTVDKEYNARIASIMEGQWGVAQQYYNYFMTGRMEPIDMSGGSGNTGTGTGTTQQGSQPGAVDYNNLGSDTTPTSAEWIAAGGTAENYPGNFNADGTYQAGNVQPPANNSGAAGAQLVSGAGASYPDANQLVNGAIGNNAGALGAGTTTQQPTSMYDAQGNYIDPAPNITSQYEIETAQRGQDAQTIPVEGALNRHQMTAADSLIDPQTGLALQQIDAAGQLITPTTQLALGQLNQQIAQLPLQGQLATQTLSNDLRTERWKPEVINAYFSNVLKGTNINQAAQEGRTTMLNELNRQSGDYSRDMSRMGLDPSSPKYAGALGQMATDRARLLAGATDNSKRTAEQTNLQNLQGALGV